MRILASIALAVFGVSALVKESGAFTVMHAQKMARRSELCMAQEPSEQAKQDALMAAIGALEGGTPLESPNVTEQRIQTLVNDNKVVLFMKGTKFFPQCGFSDTATKILEALKVEYEAVDVLADNSIRQGIKEFSQWPTIPQLYINQEFIGGSDIMISMFESGELKEMLKEES
jgi:monothiol glutaredoxin